MRLSTLLLACAVLLSTGCASIVSKSSYPMTLNSSPSEANLIITDRDDIVVYDGTTPATVRLDAGAGFFKKARYQLTFQKAGYEDVTIPLDTKLDGWYFGNFLFGGFIGFLIVDPATGAMFKFYDDFVMQSMRQVGTAANDGEAALQILNYADLTEAQRKRLVPLHASKSE